MASTAHPYTVEQHEEHEQHEQNEPHNEEQCEQLLRRFDELPRDAQWLVLKHTGARFVVTHRFQEDPLQINLPFDMFWPYFVPVIVRYEFRLLPRRASGPEMIARFTLSLDPAIRQLPEWRHMNAQHQAIFDRPGGYMAREFEPFSQLRYDEPNHLGKRFCFLRRGGHGSGHGSGHRSGQPQHIEVSSLWSRFDDSVLTEVREKMETVFRLPMTRL
jgi:hypothetical protein